MTIGSCWTLLYRICSQKHSTAMMAVLLGMVIGFSHVAAADCGGQDQRACCINEGNACQDGLTPVLGCDPSIGCQCGGILSAFNATQTCRKISHCGGDGERACCNGLSEFSNDGLACNSGEVQVPGCTGNCWCGGTGPSVAAQSSGTCQKLSACGGPGQRACCVLENSDLSFKYPGGACDFGQDLQQVPGCDPNTGNCTCASGALALGTCVKVAHCGGVGERACCTANNEYASGTTNACESGLKAVPGCAGDCTCGGYGATLGLPSVFQSFDTCTKSPIENVAEPSVNFFEPQTLPSNDQMRGYADLHVHMFAHLAHGGATLSGTPYDPNCGVVPNYPCPDENTPAANGVNKALHEDYGTSDFVTVKAGSVQNLDKTKCQKFMNGFFSDQDQTIDDFVCNDLYTFHGGHGFDTLTGGGTNDAALSPFGAPVFNGWPQSNSTIHQQVYYKWLERAWRGGMRLMVMHAVQNEALCNTDLSQQGIDCRDSMTPIDVQLKAARDFQTWLDSQNGGPGNGWFRIVTSPQEAQSVIQSGKLAVVLGIEMDNLFNCHRGTDQPGNTIPIIGQDPKYGGYCSQQYVADMVQKYYDMGVRQIFPIHNFENAFGNPAAWQDAITVGDRYMEGAWFETENCSSNPNNTPGYGFWLDPNIETIEALAGFGTVESPPYPCGFMANGLSPIPFQVPPPVICVANSIKENYSTCNAKGLTDLGKFLIQQLISHHIIIDVDHLSTRAFNDTVTIADSAGYPGIVASHVQFFDLYKQEYNPPNTFNYGRHERMRTQTQLLQIKNLGGLIAVMLKDDVQDTANGFCANAYSGTSLCAIPVVAAGVLKEGGRFTAGNYGPSNDNCRYSTTWWAQAYRKGVDVMGGPVAVGSDYNGIAGHIGPRFGTSACGGDGVERSAQEKAATLDPSDPNYRPRLQYPFTIPFFGTFGQQVSGEKKFDFNVDGLAHVGLMPDLLADLYNVDPQVDLEPLMHSAQAYVTMWQKADPQIAGGLTVTAPITVNTATPFPVTVTVVDVNGIVDTGFTGTFKFTCSDSNAHCPASVPVTNGTATETFDFGQFGTQQITVNAVDTSQTVTFSKTVNILFTTPPQFNPNPIYRNFTFTVGTLGYGPLHDFGFPTPSVEVAGALPAGVTASFNGAFDVLTGTPLPGSGGVYTLQVTASNGALPNANETVTLTVNEAPSAISPTTLSWTWYLPFQLPIFPQPFVAGNGYPLPTISVKGDLPPGMSIGPDGYFYGVPTIPAPTDGRPLLVRSTYTFLVTATNNLGSVTKKFVLTLPALQQSSTRVGRGVRPPTQPSPLTTPSIQKAQTQSSQPPTPTSDRPSRDGRASDQTAPSTAAPSTPASSAPVPVVPAAVSPEEAAPEEKAPAAGTPTRDGRPVSSSTKSSPVKRATPSRLLREDQD